MKINGKVPPAIVRAAVGLLQPWSSQLSPAGLLAAIQDYNPSGAPDPGRLYSLKETAERLGIAEPTLFKLMRDGKINTVKIGGSTKVTAAELERLLQGTQE